MRAKEIMNVRCKRTNKHCGIIKNFGLIIVIMNSSWLVYSLISLFWIGFSKEGRPKTESHSAIFDNFFKGNKCYDNDFNDNLKNLTLDINLQQLVKSCIGLDKFSYQLNGAALFFCTKTLQLTVNKRIKELVEGQTVPNYPFLNILKDTKLEKSVLEKENTHYYNLHLPFFVQQVCTIQYPADYFVGPAVFFGCFHDSNRKLQISKDKLFTTKTSKKNNKLQNKYQTIEPLVFDESFRTIYDSNLRAEVDTFESGLKKANFKKFKKVYLLKSLTVKDALTYRKIYPWIQYYSWILDELKPFTEIRIQPDKDDIVTKTVVTDIDKKHFNYTDIDVMYAYNICIYLKLHTTENGNTDYFLKALCEEMLKNKPFEKKNLQYMIRNSNDLFRLPLDSYIKRNLLKDLDKLEPENCVKQKEQLCNSDQLNQQLKSVAKACIIASNATCQNAAALLYKAKDMGFATIPLLQVERERNAIRCKQHKNQNKKSAKQILAKYGIKGH